jgi:RHS repeat-associated protein
LGSTRYIQGVVSVGAHVKSASYTYDASDNLVAETGANGFTATVNNLNQLMQVTAKGGSSTFVYDKAGNLLIDGTRTYTWDAENRLLSVTVNATKLTSMFAYDALGRRVAITDGGTTTRYRWCGEQICAARAPAGAITARYFSQGEINGTTSRYYATDHLSSVRELMDNTGSAKGTAIYHAFGKPTLTGEIPTFAYAGMFYHQASGLYLTQYRAYDPNTGRWLSRDPIGEVGGINLYAYTNDRPIESRDPRGLCSRSCTTDNLPNYPTPPSFQDWGTEYDTGYGLGWLALDPFVSQPLVGQGGSFDYQRASGVQNPGNNQYTPASNFGEGVFWQGAGISMSVMDQIGNLYGRHVKTPEKTLQADVSKWNEGWEWAATHCTPSITPISVVPIL